MPYVKKGTYYTQTPNVVIEENEKKQWRQYEYWINDNAFFREILSEGKTFNYTFTIPLKHWSVGEANQLTLQLTCRAEKKGKSPAWYYTAYTRDKTTSDKTLLKCYLGRDDRLDAKTLEKAKNKIIEKLWATRDKQ